MRSYSSTLNDDSSEASSAVADKGIADTVLGISLTVGGTVMQSLQYVYEEKVRTVYDQSQCLANRAFRLPSVRCISSRKAHLRNAHLRNAHLRNARVAFRHA